MKLLITAALLIFAAACSNDSSTSRNSIVKGKRMGAIDAAHILISSQRWCYESTANDAFYGTHVFLAGGKGEFAVWNRIQGRFTSHDPMQWRIDDDVLTMTLPQTYQPNVWRAHLRFLNGVVQLWQSDDTLQTTLHACSPQ